MTDDNSPKKFVGLHSHSVMSIGDAIGNPTEHMDFAFSNGMDALALTDHGNMCGFSHQYLHSKKMKEKGFKALFGGELYVVSSLADWRDEYKQNAINSEIAKKAKKAEKNAKKKDIQAIDIAQEEVERISDEIKSEGAGPKEEGDEGGTVVENEEETKGGKIFNPLRRRSHLVLLAKSQKGLEAIFEMVSRSFRDGFYYFPRIDIPLLKELAQGEIIATSACIGGHPSRIIFDNQKDKNHEAWNPTLSGGPGTENFELIQSKLKDLIEQYIDALGKDNYFLELQFNLLPSQHLTNMHLIEASKRTGVRLIAAADAHYAKPEHWREREIYRMMAQYSKNQSTFNVESLPKAIDELKCELYPKNADQMWKAYKECSKPYDFYNDETIKNAIELTHDIAHQHIGTVEPNRKVKLPAIEKLVTEEKIKDTPQGKDEDWIAFRELLGLARDGLRKRGKAHDKTYVDRLHYELETIKALKFSKYFLTYQKIMEECGKELFLGNARGCFVPGSQVKMSDLSMKNIEDIQVGAQVMDAHGEIQTVLDTLEYDCSEDILELVFSDGKTIRCTKDHKFLTTNRGWVEAQYLTEEDDVKEV